MERGQPKQGQADFAGVTEAEIGQNLQGGEIDIGLIEAVEQYQRIGAGLLHRQRHMAEGAEIGAEFDRQRDGHSRPHRAENVEIAALDIGGRLTDVSAAMK